MKMKFPVSKIVKLNLWLTLNTNLFFLVFGLLRPENNSNSDILIDLIFGFYVILAISFGNLGLIALFVKYFNISQNITRQKVLVICSYFLAIIITITTPSIYMIFLKQDRELTFVTLLLLVFLGVFVNTFVLVMQHYVVIQYQKYSIDVENSRLKAANYETANQLLKQQIHPHFLFNALNILKSLYKTDTREGERYLIYLSNFLRASFANDNMKVIKVKEEVALCENYIKMQKIRFGEALLYDFKIADETLNNKYVPSFSIQPLIENAIKHNELTEEQPLKLNIEQVDDWIKVTNNKKKKNISSESTGVGLGNLAERYRLLSNDELKIEEDDEKFAVSIKVLKHA